MATSVKRKKVTVTMEQKLHALFRIDAGESLIKIAQELGVDSLDNRRTLRKPNNEALYEALYIWFCQQREQGVVQAIAIKFNDKLKFDMAFVNLVDEDLMPCQIFNAHKTGLNYKMLPKKILASKLDSVAKGHKVKKERVTLLPCSNVSGDLKFQLLVVGKSAKPRTFKNKKLPGKAVLFIDNAPCHPSENELRDCEIYVKLLPPNMTALIQPMDQGVIETTKRLYRKKLIMFLLEQQEANPLPQKRGKELSQKHFKKSWKKCWPNIPQENYRRDETTSNEDTDFIQVFQELEGCAEVETNDISECINGDTDVGHQVLSDDEIVNACIENIEIEVDSSEDEDDGTDQSTGPTHGEATAMLEQLMTD
ncbi:jerky protein homolog-like [Metopolophium dirhodum]|uniref:jerky protein homolog-like n=1 Tax=Metopolophium dirhodum TaxID=44670 RepID=UPI00298FCAC5|nr:jerky protein homolog-like [Metopolophium dirhodum]